jgi:hypothetical protein
LQWLHDSSEINGVNLNNVRHEAIRYFRSKKRENLKDKISELAMNSKNKNIRDLYRGINEFERSHQPRSNLVKWGSACRFATIFETGGRTIFLSYRICIVSMMLGM